jgi:hypothetical protein
MQLLISGSQKLSILPKNLQENFPLHDPIHGSYWSLFAAGHHGVWDILPVMAQSFLIISLEQSYIC